MLEKLVSEYEENGCIGIDPYKRFYEIIQKLNFGSPFIDHVAKKTYVKTKNAIEDIDNDHNNQLEYTEEEYKELCKEFENDE